MKHLKGSVSCSLTFPTKTTEPPLSQVSLRTYTYVHWKDATYAHPPPPPPPPPPPMQHSFSSMINSIHFWLQCQQLNQSPQCPESSVVSGWPACTHNCPNWRSYYMAWGHSRNKGAYANYSCRLILHILEPTIIGQIWTLLMLDTLAIPSLVFEVQDNRVFV